MVNREKQTEVLRRTQASRKEQKKEQVLKAIAEIQTHKKPLTFKNIATVAGCSISYLYKWDEIKAYIHELQQQKETTLKYLHKINYTSLILLPLLPLLPKLPLLCLLL